MQQGVSDYLVKPVDARALIGSVADAIAQKRQFSCAEQEFQKDAAL